MSARRCCRSSPPRSCAPASPRWPPSRGGGSRTRRSPFMISGPDLSKLDEYSRRLTEAARARSPAWWTSTPRSILGKPELAVQSGPRRRPPTWACRSPTWPTRCGCWWRRQGLHLQRERRAVRGPRSRRRSSGARPPTALEPDGGALDASSARSLDNVAPLPGGGGPIADRPARPPAPGHHQRQHADRLRSAVRPGRPLEGRSRP